MELCICIYMQGPYTHTHVCRILADWHGIYAELFAFLKYSVKMVLQSKDYIDDTQRHFYMYEFIYT